MTAQNLIKLNPEIQADASHARDFSDADVDRCTASSMTVFHQRRYLDPSASTADRNASAQWLIDRGHIGCNGRMIVLREVAK